MIKSLQSFRFLAIIMVFFSHLHYLQGTSHEYFFNRVLYDGYSGVTFFIILSGFVISYNYYNRINDQSFKSTLAFVIKRLKRVYPLHIATFVISIVFNYRLLFDNTSLFFGKALSNILLIQSYIPVNSVYFSFNAVSWYISASVLFYILTPFIICTLKKVKENIRMLWMLVFLVYIIQVSYVVLTKDSAHFHWLIYINPFFRLLDYIIGCALGVIVLVQRKNSKRSKSFSILEVGSLMALTALYLYYPNIGQAYRYGVYYAPIFIMVIYVFSFEKGVLSKKIFSNWLLIYLGTISFEFYMIHQLMIRFTIAAIPLEYPILIAIASFVISIIASILLNNLINNKSIFKVKYVAE